LLTAVRAGHPREVELLRAPRRRELVALRQIIQPEPLPAIAALDQRVGEVLDVARRLPDAGMHQDRAVEAHDVVAELNHRAPPRALHVVLQLHAERAVVPSRTRAAVDLARRE